jgi:mevalonate kinase
MLKVSAPGKIILSGEHAVVYGYPAILASVDRRLTVCFGNSGNIKEGQGFIYKATNLLRRNLEIKEVTPKLRVVSEIPVGSGMGSSAALSVALSALFYKKYKKNWDLNLINNMAYQIEKIQHGNPSGGDNTVSCFGGPLLYRKKSERKMLFTHLKPTKKLPKIIIIQSGKPKETTKEMVARVRDFYLNHKLKVENIFNNLELVTNGFINFLDNGSSDLSMLIDENERLLEELGVVSANTKQLIGKIKKIGGAAKVSGAGGNKDGSGILIVYHKEPKKLIAFAKSNRLDTISVKLGEEGVRIEKN